MKDLLNTIQKKLKIASDEIASATALIEEFNENARQDELDLGLDKIKYVEESGYLYFVKPYDTFVSFHTYRYVVESYNNIFYIILFDNYRPFGGRMDIRLEHFNSTAKFKLGYWSTK